MFTGDEVNAGPLTNQNDVKMVDDVIGNIVTSCSSSANMEPVHGAAPANTPTVILK